MHLPLQGAESVPPTEVRVDLWRTKPGQTCKRCLTIIGKESAIFTEERATLKKATSTSLHNLAQNLNTYLIIYFVWKADLEVLSKSMYVTTLKKMNE